MLMDEVEAYCARTGMSKARLATIVVNDGKFFDRLDKGGGFTVRTFERFREYFEQHREDEKPTTEPSPEAA